MACSATRPTPVTNPKIHPPNLKMALHTTNCSRNAASSSCSRMKAVVILLTLNFLWISSNAADSADGNSRTCTGTHALSPVLSSMAKKHRLFSSAATTPWQFHGVGAPNDAALSGTRSTGLFLTVAPPPTTTTAREEKALSHQNKTETDHDDQDEESDSRRTAARRGLAVSAEMELPFPAEIAHDAFSDLPRQPEWSPWLHSVECIANDKQSSPVSSLSSSSPATK